MNISLFKKAALFCVLFFMGISNAWGFTSTLEGEALHNSFNSGAKTVSWTHNHVNFSFSGSCLYMTGGKHWYGDTRVLYMPNGKDIRYNENTTYTLSWTNAGYDIEVTKVTINVDRASGESSYIKVGQGPKTGDLFDRLSSANISSGSETYGNGQTVPVVFYKAFSWSTCAINSITVEYNLKPQINAANGSVEVTICDENKKKINLNTLAKPVVTNGHVSCSYSVESVTPAANTSATSATGYISGTNFYATQAGVYTIRISAASASCHQANSTTFTVTVTPATLSLTAPTASDITNHHILSTSVLTGGSASVGSCEVAGTWAWKDPSTAPEMGDDQPFAVVFTPSANKGNYTNFEITALVDVKRAQFIFDGSGSEADDPNHITWCYDDNWNENLKPGIEDEVRIEHNVVIRQEVSAYSVTINEGDTLTIMPTGGLTVGAGGITIAATGKLNLRAGTEGAIKGKTGYLRVSPKSTAPMPNATVELFSIGYYDMSAENHNELGKWQYVGYPMENDVIAKSVFSKSWFYSWNTTTAEWENTRKTYVMQPFEGYATSQYRDENGLMITFEGQLVAPEKKDIVLAYNDGDKATHNMLANSFVAPIDITKFEDEDFVNAERAVYIFNTGSRNDIKNLELTKGASVNAPGQYLSIPVGTAREMKAAFSTPTVIAPMQGFCVHATSAEASLTLDYEKIIWNGDYEENGNAPLRVGARNVTTEDVHSLRVSIFSEYGADDLYILESELYNKEYENGYDAKKKNEGDVNIFSIEGDDQLSVDATDNIVGTHVGVRTGDETAYTLVFSHLNTENELALLDNETNEKININEGTEYTFFAEPNSVIDARFQIIERANTPAITTGMENAESEVKLHKFIKDNQLFVLKNGVLYNAAGVRVR